MEKTTEELYRLIQKSISNCKSTNLALSGGLDSTIIAHFLREKDCKAIAVVAQDFVASDLTYCQLVSKVFKIPLNLVTASTEKILEAVEETIKILKIFNDIEIRNSVVIYLALDSLEKNGEKAIITGDGADELFAGYNFFKKKNEEELQKDLERIWKIMHFPSKKIAESMNMTVETPYLDEQVMEYAKKIPANLKVKDENGKIFGKWVLRKAFEGKIPDKIVWREKSAMQDGSGTAGLTGLFNSIISDKVFNEKLNEILQKDGVIIRTKESLHYYQIFRKYFDAPEKLHSSENKCPKCNFEVKPGSKFCRMCGTFPI